MEIDFQEWMNLVSNQWWSPIFYFIGSILLFGTIFSLFMEYYREKTLWKNFKEGIVITLKVSLFYFPLILISFIIVLIPFLFVLVFIFGGF